VLYPTNFPLPKRLGTAWFCLYKRTPPEDTDRGTQHCWAG
jgi:hypothetical protein